MISAETARRAVWRPLRELPQHFSLINTLTRREIAARYKGSVLGIVWAVLTPVVTIATFTLIFAGIFGARFGASGGVWEFSLYLFCGLLPWGAFAEAVQASSLKIVSQANLVKRVIFPLEILPVAQTLASLANQLFGTIALIIMSVIIQRTLHPTILWLPLLIAPQLLLTFGAAWLVASLGVFLRDIVQGIALLLMVWMYLTPIIYPEAVVPERFRPFIDANPFTHLIRSYRNIMLEGTAPDWRGLAYFTGFALIAFIFGYWWFARTRKNFADVI